MNSLYVISLFVCLAGGVQGVFLLFALNKLFREKNVDRKWLLLLIGTVTVTLLGRLLYLYPEYVDTRIPVLTDLILFLFGPLYFLFVKSVFKDTSVTKKSTKSYWYFVPAIIHLIVTVPIFIMSNEDYNRQLVEGKLMTYFNVIMIAALIHNAYFWTRGRSVLTKIEKEFGTTKIRFSAKYIELTSWWYLLVTVAFGAMIVLYQIDFGVAGIGYQLTWILASWFTYGLGYMVMTNPESFGDLAVDVKETRKLEVREQKQIEKLANRLVELLENKKVYLDPEISLLSLAKQLDTNNVMLSKTINHYFNVGFYDLINQRRVDEFIRLAGDSENNHFTYYALALQAGFNSKTSFNKYFKKFTNQTPKEYFSKLSVA